MKILAIDPSSTALGIARIVDGEATDCFTFSPKGSLILERMVDMMEQVRFCLAVVGVEKYDYAAIETPYLGMNRETAMKMGQIYGMLLAALLIDGTNTITPDQIIHIHPMTAKKAAGLTKIVDRKRGKQFVIEKMKEKFPNLIIGDDNQADAIAIGLAAYQQLKEHE